MRLDNNYHFDGCCIEHYMDEPRSLMEQAVEQAPVPVVEEVPVINRKVNWRRKI